MFFLWRSYGHLYWVDAEKRVKTELDGGDSVAEAVNEALAEVAVRKE
jgi:hypothetical protein